MRILYMGNNWLGWQVLKWLKEQGEDIVGIVVHSEEKRKYTDEMLETASLPPARVFDGRRLQTPEIMETVTGLKPDIGLSILFDYILKPAFIDLFPRGVVNLHPSYLPYNRGQYPNVWSIVEGTPAGATLHYIDKGVDTGDIIARKEVMAEPVDTGETLYRKSEQAAIALFRETWPSIRQGLVPGTNQDNEAGTSHRVSDVAAIDRIDLDKTYRARDIIDVLRARTFPPYKGAYFVANGKRVYLRLQLEYGDEEARHED